MTSNASDQSKFYFCARMIKAIGNGQDIPVRARSRIAKLELERLAPFEDLSAEQKLWFTVIKQAIRDLTSTKQVMPDPREYFYSHLYEMDCENIGIAPSNLLSSLTQLELI